MFNRVMGRILAGALSLMALGGGVAAQGFFADDAPPKAEARLLAGWADPDGSRIGALRVDLADGWKTYWRTPGEGGIPPTFDWAGSENVANIQISWPTPIVFDTYGMQTIGYKHQMTLPLRLTPKDPARPLRLKLALFYGVCDEMCIPARADLALDIAPGAAPEGAAEIRAALAAAPAPAAAAGLTGAQCVIEDGVLTARLAFTPAPTRAPVVVAEAQKGVWIGPMDARLDQGEIHASGEFRADPGEWIDRGAIRLTLIGGEGRALSLTGCPASG